MVSMNAGQRIASGVDSGLVLCLNQDLCLILFQASLWIHLPSFCGTMLGLLLQHPAFPGSEDSHFCGKHFTTQLSPQPAATAIQWEQEGAPLQFR